jgi:hypothetical protein
MAISEGVTPSAFGGSLATLATVAGVSTTLAIGAPDSDVLPFGEDVGVLNVVRLDSDAMPTDVTTVLGSDTALPN